MYWSWHGLVLFLNALVCGHQCENDKPVIQKNALLLRQKNWNMYWSWHGLVLFLNALVCGHQCENDKPVIQKNALLLRQNVNENRWGSRSLVAGVRPLFEGPSDSLVQRLLIGLNAQKDTIIFFTTGHLVSKVIFQNKCSYLLKNW